MLMGSTIFWVSQSSYFLWLQNCGFSWSYFHWVFGIYKYYLDRQGRIGAVNLNIISYWLWFSGQITWFVLFDCFISLTYVPILDWIDIVLGISRRNFVPRMPFCYTILSFSIVKQLLLVPLPGTFFPFYIFWCAKWLSSAILTSQKGYDDIWNPQRKNDLNLFFCENDIKIFWRKNDTKIFENKSNKKIGAKKKTLVKRLFTRKETQSWNWYRFARKQRWHSHKKLSLRILTRNLF